MPVNSFEDYPMSWRPTLDYLDQKEPIYIRLAEQLKQDILEGKLTPGTKLPPQRELADYLDLNLSTITRALKLCEKRGLICSAVGRGTYVASDAAAQEMIFMSDPEKKMIEMGGILPNPDINELASNYLRDMCNEPDFYKLLQYGMIEYDELQIKAAVKWFSYFNLKSDQSQILYANGSQNAIFAAMAGLLKEGDKIATLPVTYPGVKRAAKLLGVQIVPIPLYDGALTEESLEYVYKNHNIKGFYFIPDYNNPTSELMDITTRKMIGEFCSRNHLLVIEDAIYTLFRPKPLPTIASFVPEYCILIASVSKIMSPGLRLAIMHTARQYHSRIKDCLYSMQIACPALMMQLFTRLVLSDRFDIIRRLRIEELVERNLIFDRMCFELDTVGAKYSPIRWLRLPSSITADEFEKEAADNHLAVYSASRFVVGNAQVPNAIRLSLISVYTLEQYWEGLTILNKIVKKYQ